MSSLTPLRGSASVASTSATGSSTVAGSSTGSTASVSFTSGTPAYEEVISVGLQGLASPADATAAFAATEADLEQTLAENFANTASGATSAALQQLAELRQQQDNATSAIANAQAQQQSDQSQIVMNTGEITLLTGRESAPGLSSTGLAELQAQVAFITRANTALTADIGKQGAIVEAQTAVLGSLNEQSAALLQQVASANSQNLTAASQADSVLDAVTQAIDQISTESDAMIQANLDAAQSQNLAEQPLDPATQAALALVSGVAAAIAAISFIGAVVPQGGNAAPQMMSNAV